MRALKNVLAFLAIPLVLAWDVWAAARALRRLRRQWDLKPKEAPRGLRR